MEESEAAEPLIGYWTRVKVPKQKVLENQKILESQPDIDQVMVEEELP